MLTLYRNMCDNNGYPFFWVRKVVAYQDVFIRSLGSRHQKVTRIWWNFGMWNRRSLPKTNTTEWLARRKLVSKFNYGTFHCDIHKTIAYRFINRFVQTKLAGDHPRSGIYCNIFFVKFVDFCDIYAYLWCVAKLFCFSICLLLVCIKDKLVLLLDKICHVLQETRAKLIDSYFYFHFHYKLFCIKAVNLSDKLSLSSPRLWPIKDIQVYVSVYIYFNVFCMQGTSLKESCQCNTVSEGFWKTKGELNWSLMGIL